jgi:hypothetical protein
MMSGVPPWVPSEAAPAFELFVGAAVRERYRAADLLDEWLKAEEHARSETLQSGMEAVLDLEEKGRDAIAADGQAALELPEQLRYDVLRLAGPERVRLALQRQRSRTLTEEMCLALLEHRAPDLDTAGRSQLRALAAAIPWAIAAGATPDVDEKDADGALARLDFREMVGGPDLHRFVGREAQLNTLRQIWGAPAAARPVVLVEGAGGVGKSLLLAKFADLLLSSDYPLERPSAVFHFDYDRYELQSARPSVILGDMARQASRWWARQDAETLLGMARGHEGSALESVSQLSRHSEAAGDRELVTAQSLLRLLWDADHRPVIRILLIADTLEQVDGFDDVARASVRDVGDLLRRSGADVMEVYASRSFRDPAALAGSRPFTKLPLGKLTQRDASRYLIAEAKKQGIRLPKDAAHEAQRRLPPVPLALRLAIALLGDPEDFQPERWLSDLTTSRGRVQAMLYERVLDRIRYEEVRKLAKPGLLLRRLTAPIISDVLAGPCGLQLGPGDGERVMARAREEGQLFSLDPGDPDAVWHRRDVRRLMFDDLRSDIDPSVAMEIHRRAVRHYERSHDPRSRAEELYHRLQLGEPFETVDERWSDAAGKRLKDAISELPPAAAGYVRGRLGGASLESFGYPVIEYASLQSSDRQLDEVRLLARKRLQSGDRNIADVFEIAGVVPGVISPLADIFVEWLILSGRGNEAVPAAQEMRRSRRRLGGEVRSAVYASAASFLEGSDRLPEALEFWSLAVRAGAHAPENVLLGYEIGRMRTLRKLGRGLNSRKTRVRLALHRLQRVLSIVSEQPVTAREAVAELAEILLELWTPAADMLQRLASYLLEVDQIFLLDEPGDRENVMRRLGIPGGTPTRQDLNALASKLLYSSDPRVLGQLVELFREQVDLSLYRARSAVRTPSLS